MEESEIRASTETTCAAMNARGERCRKRPARGRYCLVHSGEQDMRELGRRGGQVRPNTKLRQAADDDLREKARAVLLEQLDGEDERRRFEAAKSLFTYRAAAPPSERERGDAETGVSFASGRKVVGLADLLELCVEEVKGAFDDARMQDVILRAAEQVRELQASGVRVERPKS